MLVTLARAPQFDPLIFTPAAHFVVTSAVSVLGVMLAAATGIAAERSGDVRVLLLSLAFFTISGFWVLHGLLTPTVLLAQPTTGEGWSVLVGQLGGAVFPRRCGRCTRRGCCTTSARSASRTRS